MFSARIVSILLYSRFTADSTGAAPVTMIRYRHALTGFISLHQFRDFFNRYRSIQAVFFFREVGRGIEPLAMRV